VTSVADAKHPDNPELIAYGTVPMIFWGSHQTNQGQQLIAYIMSFNALIPMGDWCELQSQETGCQ